MYKVYIRFAGLRKVITDGCVCYLYNVTAIKLGFSSGKRM